MIALTHDDCINHDGACEGDVEYHSLGMGNAFPRCELHWEKRLESYENSDLERYANSDVPPSWFDPDAIGERWSEDDY